ncbi:MAG TPA: glycosyltransferase family 4 protein [Terriglobia bacterium]
MNILMLTAYPPVLQMHGGGVRMYHNIRILAQQHGVRVISFVENERERELLRSLEGVCESITAVQRIADFRPHWLSLDPFLVREFDTPAMHEAIEAAFCEKPVDVLQCEYLQMAQYKRRGVFSVLTIIETQSDNAWAAFQKESDPSLKLKLFYRWMQVLRYEVSSTRRFDRVVTMTEEDAVYLRSYSPDVDIRAIPIGINPEEFRPLAGDPTHPLKVLFVGNFRHTPNVEAARFLVTEIAPFFPQLRFVLSGANLPEDLKATANVDCPGYVTDLRTLYERPNTIVMAPLFSGTGQRVKLLEAFSMACPIVATSIAAYGYPVSSGREMLIANSAADFRHALAQLVSSEELRTKLGMAGREMILKRLDWLQIGPRLLEVVNPS